MPPFRKDCQPETTLVPMDMVYPKEDAKLFIPRNMDGKPGSSLFELAHRDPSRSVHWHLDGIYVGTTTQVHHLALSPPAGKHTLTMVDDSGEFLQRQFEVISGGK
jgi:penicillin-binding protein 1C